MSSPLRDDDPRLELFWTKEQIVTALCEYEQCYGDDFSSAAFNPSLAEWRDRPDLAERYQQGNPLHGGKPWPSLNTIKRRFGSWNAARDAAGLSANRPGGARRPAGEHSPNRLVQHRVVVLPSKKSRNALKRADVAEARATKAERRVKELEAELAELRAQLAVKA